MPTAPRTLGSYRTAQKEHARGTATERGYDSHWARISRMYREEHPVCEICHDAPTVDVDHVIPFKGRNDPKRTRWDNLQSVCRACHRAKTACQGG